MTSNCLFLLYHVFCNAKNVNKYYECLISFTGCIVLLNTLPMILKCLKIITNKIITPFSKFLPKICAQQENSMEFCSHATSQAD